MTHAENTIDTLSTLNFRRIFKIRGHLTVNIKQQKKAPLEENQILHLQTTNLFIYPRTTILSYHTGLNACIRNH